MQQKTLLLIVGFVLFWNSGFIGAEYGLPYAGPFTLLFWRYLLLTLVVLIYLLAWDRFRWVGWRIAAPNMLNGVLAHGVWLSCALLALDNGVPAGIVALVVALQPLATGALSSLVTGEQTGRFQWIGLIVGFFGVLLTVLTRINFQDSTSIFGYLIPMGSVLGITIASLVQRRMTLKGQSSTLPVDLSLFYQGLPTTFLLALPAFLLEDFSTQWEPAFIYTIIWLSLAVSLAAYGLMWLLLERMSATRVASLFYLGPPVTMFMAWIAFGDQVATIDIIGVAVVFVGVGLTQLKDKAVSGAT